MTRVFQMVRHEFHITNQVMHLRLQDVFVMSRTSYKIFYVHNWQASCSLKVVTLLVYIILSDEQVSFINTVIYHSTREQVNYPHPELMKQSHTYTHMKICIRPTSFGSNSLSFDSSSSGCVIVGTCLSSESLEDILKVVLGSTMDEQQMDSFSVIKLKPLKSYQLGLLWYINALGIITVLDQWL